ncbi:MAG: DinB family protein [Bacteroidota bacterium]
MEKTPWFNRKFSNILNNGLFPGILERLEGTSVRLETKVKGIDETRLTAKPDEVWSIKENIGHLWILEPLWLGRIEDIKNDVSILREADLSNSATDEAGFNNQLLEDILTGFRLERRKLLSTLSSIAVSDLEKIALHPRMRTPMRIIDLAFFIAEHDDHHLAQISFLKKMNS